MADSELQNAQRGGTFMLLFNIVVLTVFIIIKLIQNRLDPSLLGDKDPKAKKYEDGASKPADKPADKADEKPAEKAAPKPSVPENVADSSVSFDAPFQEAHKVTEEDGVNTKFMKRSDEYQYYYLPYLTFFALILVSGTMRSFSMVMMFLFFLVILVINILRIHKGTCGVTHPVFIIILESLWFITLLLLILNVWVAPMSLQPYNIA